MIEIIDPDSIRKRKEVIKSLKFYGIDHTRRALTSGWNYVIDHVWLEKEIGEYIKTNGTDLTILDVGCGNSPFHNYMEEMNNIKIIGIDRPEGYCHQEKTSNIDIYANFLEMVFLEERM